MIQGFPRKVDTRYNNAFSVKIVAGIDKDGGVLDLLLDDIAKQDYVLTPGRYVGIADEVDDGVPFADKMAHLTAELGDLFAESHRLESAIREKLAGIGFEVKEE